MSVENCPLCKKTAHTSSAGTDEVGWRCRRCGEFSVTGTGAGIGFLADRERTRLSWLTRRQYDSDRRVRFDSAGLFDLLRAAPNPTSPLDSVDELLRLVESRYVSQDQAIRIELEDDYPAILAQSPSEMGHLVDLAVGETLKWLRRGGDAALNVYLTAEGWRRVVDLRCSRPRSDEAFVAMSFHRSLQEAYDRGIKPALDETGYSPIPVDREEQNAKIDDEIVAHIRASSLVVADFTLQRTGVYFEAGFALGLGLPV